MKAAPQSTADYYATINALARFLFREGESGYVFALVEDERILPEIFDILSSKAVGRGKQLLFTRLIPESDQSLLQQILQSLEKHPKTDALSIVGLDELLEKKPGTGQLTKTGQNHLLELNFARESLNRLDRPIVFWINPENQALLANQAADLFGQRRLSTFYFSYHPEVFDDNPFFQDRFKDGSHDPAEYERLKLRTNLLEKQLEEAESKKYPPAKIARDIALPLAISYSRLGDIYQAQGKFKEALDYFKKQTDLFEELFQANPHNVDLENGLAISYYKLAEIYRAIPNSETDPAPYYRRAVEIWERILQRTGWPKLEGYIEHVKKRLEEG